ncbi:hypothetical protein RI129_010550 [Pyrocoelia pectoralis]|uniref:Alcohol dehydrogenase n=1 Tax=Pyrocoelia pectoralis TaxID=417401 RepID=A0AAN7VAA1_9COLE
MVDINVEKGERVTKALNEVFGDGKVIFIPTDVGNQVQLENAFRVSIDHWRRLDIVVNNAGVFNENNWRLMMNVNAVGALQGTLLALEYMSSKGKGGRGGVLINVSSISAINSIFYGPIYAGTKNFIVGLSRSLGNEVYYDYNHVRILTLCPGATITNILGNFTVKEVLPIFFSPDEGPAAQAIKNDKYQRPSSVGKAFVFLIKKGSNGSVWVVEDDQLPYEVDFVGRKLMQKKKACQK